jgi:hypothetical protein
MPVETAADRAVFVNPDEFGVEATYVLNGGGTYGVTGIFDAEYDAIVQDEFGAAGVVVNPPQFEMREADLPKGWGDGDEIIIAKEVYKVRVHERDGTGMVNLRLEG